MLTTPCRVKTEELVFVVKTSKISPSSSRVIIVEVEEAYLEAEVVTALLNIDWVKQRDLQLRLEETQAAT